MYQKKKNRQSRPQSSTDALSSANNNSNGSVRLKLNKLNNYEADDAKMVTVFGVANEETPSSMKLNPLFDKNGVIEVTAEEANMVRKATMSAKNYQPKQRPRSNEYSSRTATSKSVSSSDVTPEVIEPKIAYSRNFRFKNSQKSTEKNGDNSSSDRNGSVKNFGRVMPSRIQKNTQQSLASTQSSSRPVPSKNGSAGSRKPDVEAQIVQDNIRRRCRTVVLIILSVLLMALIITIVLYFTIREHNSTDD